MNLPIVAHMIPHILHIYQGGQMPSFFRFYFLIIFSGFSQVPLR